MTKLKWPRGHSVAGQAEAENVVEGEFHAFQRSRECQVERQGAFHVPAIAVVWWRIDKYALLLLQEKMATTTPY